MLVKVKLKMNFWKAAFYCMICSYCFIPFLSLSSSNMCTATIVNPTTLVKKTYSICNLINPLMSIHMNIMAQKHPTICKYG